MIALERLDRAGIAWAQDVVTRCHYLRRPVDPRVSLEGYAVHVEGVPGRVGLLLFGRPEATRCADWYGSVDDVRDGRCAVTRWQVLNLARVWLSPDVQAGGVYCDARYLPGFTDRTGSWRSILASSVVRLAIGRVGYEYLLARPPCFLDEPYAIRWLLSYCDSTLHSGTLYRASGFTLYRTNERGIQTWRAPLPALTVDQDVAVQAAARANPRSIRYRAQRAATQPGLWEGAWNG